MKITYILNTDISAYGEISEAQHEIIHSREEHIASAMGMDTSTEDDQLGLAFERNNQFDDRADELVAQELCERIYMLAMECADIRPDDDVKLVTAVNEAMELFPMPE